MNETLTYHTNMIFKRLTKLPVYALAFLCLLTSCKQQESTIRSIELTCENQVNPEGINITSPHLSWILVSPARAATQTAWQILVASSPGKLDKNEGDLWNSEKQKSDQSVLVKYEGEALHSGMACYWKVRIWDQDGRISPWSETARWSIGLLNPEHWKGKWIGTEKVFPGEDTAGQFRKLNARYLRKEFNISKPIKKATANISGLGLYELHINGGRTGNLVLAPGATDYTKTIFYNTYDVTPQLSQGSNAIGVILGNGRYFAMRKDEPFLMQNYGFPKLLMQIDIEFNDGSHKVISTDSTWKLTANGPITENNEFDGEKYDARLEMPGWDKPGFDAKNWMDAEIVEEPAGMLTGQLNEPIRVTVPITPVSVKKLRPGVYIYDMGQNMVGWVSLSAKGHPGQKITMRFAETLKPDGSLYLANIRSAKVTDSYIFNADNVTDWQPAFTY
ncbi:MAG TPA: family 78 glycoside hydrolase catalytic domain, partial [Bacteroidales bacterium]|nr:family 78 glycoside hydrolase catalytic domain [Bacteroidales bacterium]